MHARVAAFENPRFDDPSLVDELSRRARESAPRWQESLRSALGHLILVDRENKRSLGITFFPDDAAIREAAPVFERMGDEIPEEQRGRRTSVDSFEVVINEGSFDQKAARVSRIEGDPSQMDEGAQHARSEIMPRLRELPGYKGALGLVDRSSGRTLLVSFWESEQAMRSSEQPAEGLRKQAAEAGGGRITGVERYQVMYAKEPSEVGASR
jgi:hypothetical protein